VPYFLGVDGGGSKTTAAIGDESRILATAAAGPSNIVRVGEPQARESLHQCVRQACAAAAITPAQIAHTCIGAAGAARPEIAALIRRALAEILPSAIDVVGDTQIAVEAAFDDGPGVIVIAGTGSIAYGRDAHGATARAGGWGFVISDEGSAHWIGRAAVTAALRANDPAVEGVHDRAAHPDPPLLSALQKAWGTRSLEDFVRAANSTPAPDFSALFPAVLACAEANDNAAQRVLAQAGSELAQIAVVVIRRLFPKPAQQSGGNPAAADAPVPLAMVGGVFRHAPQVRQVFYNEIRQQDLRVQLNPEIVNPVEGALRLARKAAQCGADTPVRRF
jgi:N-acetylglucosamine kinase-like BadF-type ATPase